MSNLNIPENPDCLGPLHPQAMNYTVTQSTKIVGATLDVLTLNQLKIGEKIKIKTKEGSEEVSAIKVIK